MRSKTRDRPCVKLVHRDGPRRVSPSEIGRYAVEMTKFSAAMLDEFAIRPLKRLEEKATAAGNQGVQRVARLALGEIEVLKRFISQLEKTMGQTATEIAALEALATQQQQQITTLTAANAGLQSQLTALAGQPVEDAADVAAVSGVQAFITGLTGAPAASTPAASTPAASTPAVTAPAPSTPMPSNGSNGAAS